MKSPDIDESGEGTTHDPRSLRRKTTYGTTWAPKADWLNLTTIPLQIICVLLSKVARGTLGPERKRSAENYLR